MEIRYSKEQRKAYKDKFRLDLAEKLQISEKKIRCAMQGLTIGPNDEERAKIVAELQEKQYVAKRMRNKIECILCTDLKPRYLPWLQTHAPCPFMVTCDAEDQYYSAQSYRFAGILCFNRIPARFPLIETPIVLVDPREPQAAFSEVSTPYEQLSVFLALELLTLFYNPYYPVQFRIVK